MENNLNILPEPFVQFLTRLLKSEGVSIFLLYDMPEAVLPTGWKITNSASPDRKYAFEKHPGFITVGENPEQAFNQLVATAKALLTSVEHTPQGVCNLLLVVSFFGSVHDEIIEDGINELFAEIADKEVTGVINELINYFNEVFPVSKILTLSTSYTDYATLYLRQQYIRIHDTPLDLLVLILNRRDGKEIISCLEKMKPNLAMALSNGWLLAKIKESDMLDHLEERNADPVFWAFVLMERQPAIIMTPGSRLLTYFITRYWERIGRFYLRKVFLASTGKLNEEHAVSVIIALDTYLVPYFFEVDKGNEILRQEVGFTNDIAALGYWFGHIEQTRLNGVLNKSSIHEMTRILSKQFQKVNIEIPVYVLLEQRTTESWFADLFDPGIQMATKYLLFAALNSEEKYWVDCRKNFTNLCHQLKLQYYGTYGSVYFARQMCFDLLSFLLAYPNREVENQSWQERLKQLISDFRETVGYGWVRITEAEDLIWNHRHHQQNFSDRALLFVLHKLNDIPERYVDLVRPLKETIKEYASVPWPLKD